MTCEDLDSRISCVYKVTFLRGGGIMVQRFPAIDSLRGFAAVSVLAAHVIDATAWKSFPIEGPLVWFRIGFFGVDLFFVISGFVVTHMALTVYAKDPAAFWSTFAVSRLCRIVPLYLLTMAAFLMVVSPGFVRDPQFWRHLMMHLGFIHNLTYETYGTIDAPNWSVAAEMQFYACLALVLPLLMRVRLPYLLVGCIVIAWAWKYAAFQIADDSPLRPFHLKVLTEQVPACLDEFGFGIVLAFIVRTERYKALSAMPWFAPVCALVAFTAVTVALKIFWLDTEFWHNPIMVTMFRTLLGFAFALAIFAACQIKGAALRLLAPLQYLGTISYGIYLWHWIVLLKLQNLDLTPWEVLAGTLAVTFVLSALSWHLFESPMVSMGRKLLSRADPLAIFKGNEDDLYRGRKLRKMG